jgi:uncharacterized protein (UPF0305 family)
MYYRVSIGDVMTLEYRTEERARFVVNQYKQDGQYVRLDRVTEYAGRERREPIAI